MQAGKRVHRLTQPVAGRARHVQRHGLVAQLLQ